MLDVGYTLKERVKMVYPGCLVGSVGVGPDVHVNIVVLLRLVVVLDAGVTFYYGSMSCLW